MATATAVRYVGAKPIFADVDPITWCIDPTSVASKMSERTRAIMPVHLYWSMTLKKFQALVVT